MGSIAEEIFRNRMRPVLTIGPSVRNGAHNGGRFHNILYATDFSTEADAAAPYALSFAEESQARLTLLHVLPEPNSRRDPKSPNESVADAMHWMQRLVPKGAETGADRKQWCASETLANGFWNTQRRPQRT